MAAVRKHKTQIDEVRKRLNRSDVHDDDHIDELKDRLSSVRSGLLRKQEIIESQKQEIESLREENGQLSDMLDQALAALDARPNGALRDVVQEFDSQISDLLGDSEPGAAVADADPPTAEAAADPGAAVADADPPTAEAAADRSAASPQGGDRQKPRSSAGDAPPPSHDVVESPPPSNESEAAWQPESDSPALRRIMGRRRR